jgi:glycerophosphoryl diester phosphodiesterase
MATRPLLRFAHRGASALAPENTLAAFEEAWRLGCEWVETDLRLTADDVPILLHDETLERTTGAAGPAGRMTLEAIRRLDAGSWFGARFRGERIPTLDEALEWSRDRCCLNLEVKEKNRTARLVEAVAGRIREHRALDRVLCSSFRPDDLRRLRGAMPRAGLGWLVSKTTQGLRRLDAEVDLAALHPKDSLATRRLLRRCGRMGLAAHVWVVNRPDRLRELEELGADGVMTDDPRIFGRGGEPAPR